MMNSSLAEKGYEPSIWGTMSHHTQKMDIIKSVFIHIFTLPYVSMGIGRVGENVDVSLLAISNLQVEHPNKTGEILFFETQLQTPKVQTTNACSNCMTKLSFTLPHKISKNSDVVYVNYK
jgi:hypothetical protein